MKFVNTLLVVLALSSMAPSLAPASQIGCNSECGAPPSTVAFSYDNAIKYFENGVVPSVAGLQGDWIMVGMVTLPGYPGRSWVGYNPSGLDNGDGSKETLRFSQGSAFDDSIQNIVSLLNLGRDGKNQGPSEVVYNGQGACFAQWGYDAGTHVLLDTAHFSYACRLINGNQDKLVCQVSYHVDKPAEVSTAYDGQVIAFTGFVRRR